MAWPGKGQDGWHGSSGELLKSCHSGESVLMSPGDRQFTWMPVGASSTAKDIVKPSRQFCGLCLLPASKKENKTEKVHGRSGRTLKGPPGLQRVSGLARPPSAPGITKQYNLPRSRKKSGLQEKRLCLSTRPQEKCSGARSEKWTEETLGQIPTAPGTDHCGQVI